MSFIESPRFPDEIAAWSVGGRGFRTDVVQTYGGQEYRNSTWAYAMGKWNISEAFRTTIPNNAYNWIALRNLFRAARGQLNAFRFRDPLDNADEGAGVLGATGVGVASTLIYQMFKNYAVSPGSDQQIIQKPVVGATRIFKNGVLQLLGTNYAIDESTGLVTFVAQPTIGTPLTWTGSFDIPVRFDFDMPQIGLDSSGALLHWQAMNLIEVRL